MKIHTPIKDGRMLGYPNGNISQFYGNKLPQADGKSFYAMFGLDGHNGLDIVAPFRTPILGTKGTVCEVKSTAEGLGKHVRILTKPHNGEYLELSYGHLDEIVVNIGDDIKDGQVIGYMGNTGTVVSSAYITNWGLAPARGGVHLHLTVRECSVEKTPWVTSYPYAKRAYIKNYNNGYKGAVDPMQFMDIPKEVPFPKDLKLGMSDPDVIKLQKFLNSHHCHVAYFGPGSQGNETGYFGQMTMFAVMKFQWINKFLPTGVWNKQCRDKANSFPEW